MLQVLLSFHALCCMSPSLRIKSGVPDIAEVEPAPASKVHGLIETAADKVSCFSVLHKPCMACSLSMLAVQSCNSLCSAAGQGRLS